MEGDRNEFIIVKIAHSQFSRNFFVNYVHNEDVKINFINLVYDKTSFLKRIFTHNILYTNKFYQTDFHSDNETFG